MRLAVLTEASQFGRGNIQWYLNSFFKEEDAYDDPEVKYYHVRHPFQVLLKLPHWVEGREVDAVELTYTGKRPYHLKAWVKSKNGTRSTPLSANLLDNFGELVEIHENRKVDLPKWDNG